MKGNIISCSLFFVTFVENNFSLFILQQMDKQIQTNINKDLVLREKLAIARTQMANDTTLLAFIRTALYFSIAGMSVNRLLSVKYGLVIEIIFLCIAFLILLTGLYKYYMQKRNLKDSEKHIGNYRVEGNE